MVEYSVIIPACNEAENLPALASALQEAIAANRFDAEAIVIDDGSTDSTPKILAELERKYPFLRHVRHERNMGITAAIKTGQSQARGSIIIFLPSDMQSDPREDIPKLISKLKEGYDVAVGVRKVWNRPPIKVIESRIYSILSNLAFGVRIRDFNWVRAYRKSVSANMKLRQDWHRYFVVLAANSGYRVGEVEVVEHPRRLGKSKFNFSRIITGFLDLLSMKFYLSFTRRPMVFFGAIGIASFALGALGGLYFTYLYLAGDPGATSRPFLFLLVALAIIGVQSFSLGFLAEMIANKEEF